MPGREDPTIDSPLPPMSDVLPADPPPATPGRAPQGPPVSEAPDCPETPKPKTSVSLPALPPPPEGAPQIDGYHLIEKLGEGGMGVVWKAIQLATRRPVALKLLSAAAFASEPARLRFEREVELAARLEHPCIARVYDSGLTHGLHYYAMELIEGVDLETFVRTHQLSPRDTLLLMHAVCLGVQHAHQRGIIHRDLKPSNILVAQPTDDTTTHANKSRSADASKVSSAAHPAPLKIVDFGLAKAMDPDASGYEISQVGQIAGTPAYMSPEQASGQINNIDTRTDVYALGVILYRLLTGQYPHDTTLPFNLLLRHICDDEVPHPRQLSAETSRLIDRELETLMLKALDKNPERRYETAGALAQDLDNYLHDRPLIAKEPTTMYVVKKQLRRHRTAVLTAAGFVALLAGSAAGGVYWLANRPAVLRINSNPPGAAVKVDGVLKEGCGLTPCRAELGPGRHTIELVLKGHHQTHVRTIDVKWGQIAGDAYEPIQLAPSSRTFIIKTTPTIGHGEFRDLQGQTIESFTTPHSTTLPKGKYHLFLASEVDDFPEQGELIEVFGSTMPVTLERSLQQTTTP